MIASMIAAGRAPVARLIPRRSTKSRLSSDTAEAWKSNTKYRVHAGVTSNNGKRVEKVTIRKQGNQYFAQRENEPSIYELSASTVEDLQKAAADVKEAAPEPAKKK